MGSPKDTGKRVTRRELLKAVAALVGGAAFNDIGRGLISSEAKSQKHLLENQTFIPLVSNFCNNFAGKVVQVQSQDATSWNGQTRYWEHVEQRVVDKMVNRGIMELTRAASVEDAWRSLLPYYQPGEVIAIKVNFNNCWSCSSVKGVIDALIHPVNAVVKGLEQIGVNRSDVWVFDAVRALPARFVNAGLPGIRFFDKYCNRFAGFSSQPDAYINFNPPQGMSMPVEKVTDVVRNAAYLINMPIMKGGHPLAGVTLGFKNHFGTIHNCSALHDYVDVVNKPPAYNPDYNPMLDFYNSPHIGGKTVLTIGDAIFAARDFNDPPETWWTFGYKLPKSLFFATDPVAVDCVMHDLIEAELGADLSKGANRYLVLAGRAGIGVYETINPWSDSYCQINFKKFII